MQKYEGVLYMDNSKKDELYNKLRDWVNFWIGNEDAGISFIK